VPRAEYDQRGLSRNSQEDIVKPLFQSRTFWVGIVITFCGAFLASIQSAPPGTFAPWVVALSGAVVAGLGAVVIILRASDNSANPATVVQAPAPITAIVVQPPAPAPAAPIVDAQSAEVLRRVLAQFDASLPGSAPVPVPGAPAAFRIVGFVAVLALMLSSCGSAWPAACKRDGEGVYQCKCQAYGIHAVHATGEVTQSCYGALMPIKVHGAQIIVTKPTAVTP
jgi:hypothetical protein